MLTAVTETSIDAFHSLKAEGKQKDRILAKFQPGDRFTRRQIAAACDLETSTTSARVNALLKSGQLMKAGLMECPLSGKQVEALALSEPQLRLI